MRDDTIRRALDAGRHHAESVVSQRHRRPGRPAMAVAGKRRAVTVAAVDIVALPERLRAHRRVIHETPFAPNEIEHVDIGVRDGVGLELERAWEWRDARAHIALPLWCV